jgi:hypothetical protein
MDLGVLQMWAKVLANGSISNRQVMMVPFWKAMGTLLPDVKTYFLSGTDCLLLLFSVAQD